MPNNEPETITITLTREQADQALYGLTYVRRRVNEVMGRRYGPTVYDAAMGVLAEALDK